MRAFLGLANQTRHYIKDFANLSFPLSDTLRGHTKRCIKKITWNDQMKNSFKTLKKELRNIIGRSQPDFKKPFVLQTDASEKAIGALLLQENTNGNHKLIYAWSRVLSPCEQNYSTTDKELLALVKSIEHFRHYLLGRKFLLLTDHRSLEYLWESSNLNSRLVRWSLYLQEYEFEVRYIKGDENGADGVSRYCFKTSIKSQETSNTINITDSNIKNKIIHDYHLTTGHGRLKTMLHNISQRYRWDTLKKDIKNYLESCLICLKSGGPIVNTKCKIIKTNSINDIWEIDLIGRLLDEDGKNKFILVIIDHYSKWTEAFVLQKKEANNVAHSLRK